MKSYYRQEGWHWQDILQSENWILSIMTTIQSLLMPDIVEISKANILQADSDRFLLKHAAYTVWKIISLCIHLELRASKLPTRFCLLFLFISIINRLFSPKTIFETVSITLIMFLARLGGLIRWWLLIGWRLLIRRWRLPFRWRGHLAIFISSHNGATDNTILIPKGSTFALFFWALNIGYNAHIFFSLFLECYAAPSFIIGS